MCFNNIKDIIVLGWKFSIPTEMFPIQYQSPLNLGPLQEGLPLMSLLMMIHDDDPPGRGHGLAGQQQWLCCLLLHHLLVRRASITKIMSDLGRWVKFQRTPFRTWLPPPGWWVSPTTWWSAWSAWSLSRGLPQYWPGTFTTNIHFYLGIQLLLHISI